MAKVHYGVLCFFAFFVSFVWVACTPKSEYSFMGKELCNGTNGPIRFLELDTFRRYGAAKPYHIKMIDSDESIHVSFNIIDDCCQEPVENLSISESEIVISSGYKGEKCDCICDYLFSYSFSKKFVADRVITVK